MFCNLSAYTAPSTDTNEAFWSSKSHSTIIMGIFSASATIDIPKQSNSKRWFVSRFFFFRIKRGERLLKQATRKPNEIYTPLSILYIISIFDYKCQSESGSKQLNIFQIHFTMPKLKRKISQNEFNTADRHTFN